MSKPIFYTVSDSNGDPLTGVAVLLVAGVLLAVAPVRLPAALLLRWALRFPAAVSVSLVLPPPALALAAMASVRLPPLPLLSPLPPHQKQPGRL